MAWTQLPTRITLVATDAAGAKARHSIHVPAITPAADALTFAGAYADLVAAVIDTEAVTYEVSHRFFEDTYPDGTNDVEDKMVFILSAQQGGSSTFAMPGCDESKLLGTGPVQGVYVDVEDADVAALLDAIIAGIDTVRPCDSRGMFFERLDAAYKQQRASYKSQGRKG